MNHAFRRASAAAAALAMLLTACGGDDEPADPASTETETDDAGDDAGDDASGDGETAAAGQEGCEAFVRIVDAFMMRDETEGDDVTEGEDAAEGNKKFVAEVIGEDLAVVQAADFSDPDVQAVTETIVEFGETGNDDLFEGDEFFASLSRAQVHLVSNCEWENTATVVGVDYAFEGAPTNLAAGGTTAVAFENAGTEEHEMIVLRKKDDTTESWDELLEMEEDQAMGKVDFVGAAFAPPGQASAAFLTDLQAGDYIMVCFIPVGATPDANEEEVDGPPHFTQGMRHEFTVA